MRRVARKAGDALDLRPGSGDLRVLENFGLLMYTVQHFEFTLGGVLEVQLGLQTWEEREPHFRRWLTMSAGAVARELHLPEDVAADLRELIKLRNRITHFWLIEYLSATQESEAVDLAIETLGAWGLTLNKASHRLHDVGGAIENEASEAEISRIWHGSEPVMSDD